MDTDHLLYVVGRFPWFTSYFRGATVLRLVRPALVWVDPVDLNPCVGVLLQASIARKPEIKSSGAQ